MNASISVVCYTSKTLSNGEHPIMLQVSKNGVRKYKSLGISINPKHWDFSKNKPTAKCPNREYIQKIILDKQTELQEKILQLSSERKDYTPDVLVKDDNKIVGKTVGEFYRELIDYYASIDKRGNRRVYMDSYNSLKSFNKGHLNIQFQDIDVSWLKKYEKWLRSKNCKDTTTSLFFRTLRSAYNKAIKANCVKQIYYPFSEFKTSKFDISTEKRAISKADILKIIQLDLSREREYIRFSRDIFTFSYLCGGINFTDIANLKPSNIINERLDYIRQKTGKRITISLKQEAVNIIQAYSRKDNYLFPVLDKNVHETATQKENRIHKVLGKVDKCLKVIGKLAGLEANLTTYVARHSFASVLKKSGVNVALISEALGHSDLATTQIYLDSFDNDQIDEAMNNLL